MKEKIEKDGRETADVETRLNNLAAQVRLLGDRLQIVSDRVQGHSDNWKRFCTIGVGSIAQNGKLGASNSRMLVAMSALLLFASVVCGETIWQLYDGDSLFGTCKVQASGGSATLTVDRVVATMSGNISGDGSGLTNLSAANLAAGKIATAIDGSAVTNLNGANIASGNIAVGRIAYALTNATAVGLTNTQLRGVATTILDMDAANLTAGKIATAIDGSAVTNISAANLAAGKIATAIDGSSVTNLSAANLTAGKIATAIDGSAITNLSGANIASGNIAVGRIAYALTNATAVGLTNTQLRGVATTILDIDAANLTAGKIATAIDGGAVTNLSAANLTAGKIATAIDGSGITNITKDVFMHWTPLTATTRRNAFTPSFGVRIVSMSLISDTATTGSNAGTNWSFQVSNVTDSIVLGEAKTTAGAELAAFTPWNLTVTSNLAITADDVITVCITTNGDASSLAGAQLYLRTVVK